MKKNKFSVSLHIMNAVMLICIFCAGGMAVGSVWAKYYGEYNAEDSATVAYFTPSLSFDVDIDISGIKLGDSVESAFQVQNYTDEKVSEVAVKYKIVLKTTGNLPLTFTLYYGDSSLEWSCDGMRGEQYYTYESPNMFSPVTPQAHSYRLKAEWRSSQNGAQFAGKTDAVYLSAVWEQID